MSAPNPRIGGNYWTRKIGARIVRKAASRNEYPENMSEVVAARYVNGGLRTEEQIEYTIKKLTRARRESIRDWTINYERYFQNSGGHIATSNQLPLAPIPHIDSGAVATIVSVAPAGRVISPTTANAPHGESDYHQTVEMVSTPSFPTFLGNTFGNQPWYGYQPAEVSGLSSGISNASPPSRPVVLAPHPGFLGRPGPMLFPEAYGQTALSFTSVHQLIPTNYHTPQIVPQHISTHQQPPSIADYSSYVSSQHSFAPLRGNSPTPIHSAIVSDISGFQALQHTPPLEQEYEEEHRNNNHEIVQLSQLDSDQDHGAGYVDYTSFLLSDL